MCVAQILLYTCNGLDVFILKTSKRDLVHWDIRFVSGELELPDSDIFDMTRYNITYLYRDK